MILPVHVLEASLYPLNGRHIDILDIAGLCDFLAREAHPLTLKKMMRKYITSTWAHAVHFGICDRTRLPTRKDRLSGESGRIGLAPFCDLWTACRNIVQPLSTT